MRTVHRSVTERWDWRISAQMRLLSLLSIWLLAFGSPVIGPAVPFLFAVRMPASGAQLLLNSRLARRLPIEPRDRGDWALFALAFLGSVAAAAIGRVTGDPRAPLLLLPVIVPFSVIQLRAYRRSVSAHIRAQVRPEPIPFPARPQPRAA